MFLEFIIIHQLTLTHKYSLHKMTRCFYSAVCWLSTMSINVLKVNLEAFRTGDARLQRLWLPSDL